MKRTLMGLLASLALFAGLFVISAPPASAAGCATDNRSSSTTWNFNNATWQITATTFQQSCTTTTGDRYAKPTQYRVVFNRISTTCGTGPNPVTGWVVDPDILGAWNPTSKTINSCSATFDWNAPNGMIVWASATFDQRCIDSVATAKVNLFPDQNVDVPIICVVA